MSPRNRSTSSSVRKTGALVPPSCLDGGPHGKHAQYTRADFGQEAVGGLSNFPSPINHRNAQGCRSPIQGSGARVQDHDPDTNHPASQYSSGTIGTGHGSCRADTETVSRTAVEQVTTSASHSPRATTRSISQQQQQGAQEMLDKVTLVAPFGKEDTAAELQSHAARTQDTLVDAVENAEVTEIKRAVFRAFDTSQSCRGEAIRYDCPT